MANSIPPYGVNSSFHTVEPVSESYSIKTFTLRPNESIAFAVEARPLTSDRITQPKNDRTTWRLFASTVPNTRIRSSKFHPAKLLPKDAALLTRRHTKKMSFPTSAEALRPDSIRPPFPAHVPDRVTQGLFLNYVAPGPLST